MRACSFLVASAVLALTSCSDRQQEASTAHASQPGAQAATVPPSRNPKDRIDPGVFVPDTKADYPKLAAAIGESWARTQSLREAAAFKALENPLCRNVDMSEISGTRSTPSNLVVFVYCNNGKDRFDFNEADVRVAGAPIANGDRAIDRAEAIKACSEAAKSLALYPSLVETHTWAGASFSVYRPTGAARVLLDFETTNAFGQKLPYRADCLFPMGKPAEIAIAPR